jgi:hypothetical protein
VRRSQFHFYEDVDVLDPVPPGAAIDLHTVSAQPFPTNTERSLLDTLDLRARLSIPLLEGKTGIRDVT